MFCFRRAKNNGTVALDFSTPLISFSAGDFVYLQPAEPNLPLYIARIDALLQLNTTAAAASQLPTAEAASDDERPQSSVDSAQKSMSATVTWFYRPLELDQDSALPIFPNEVFASDEQATHPLDAGKKHY